MPTTHPTPIMQIVKFRAEGKALSSILRDAVKRIVYLIEQEHTLSEDAVQIKDELAYCINMPNRAWLLLVVSPSVKLNQQMPDTKVLTLTFSDKWAEYKQLADRVFAELEALSLTSLETAEVTSQFPLTLQKVPSLFSHQQPLRSLGILLTVHFITDCISLIEGLIKLGGEPKRITIIDKGYPYPYRRRIEAHLRHHYNIEVFPGTEINQALQHHVTKIAAQGKRSIIIDNGGYVLPALVTKYPTYVPEFVGLVEATMSGITRIANLSTLPLPIFSFAESRTKAAIEPITLAESAVLQIQNMLEYKSLAGKVVLVIGFGQIGEATAKALQKMYAQVIVYDQDIVRLVYAHKNGFTTGRDLTEIITRYQPKIIIGATGSTSLTQKHFAAMKKSCYLASLGSRTHEFNLQDLANIATVDPAYHNGTIYVFNENKNIKVTVLADGYPINFYASEGLPNTCADVLQASLLVGACTLASPGHGFTPGHNLARTNKSLEDAQLLDSYYELILIKP